MIHALASSPALLIAVTGVFGLLVGSFLNVVIARLPARLEHAWRRQCEELDGTAPVPAPAAPPPGLVHPRSRCPHCGHTLAAWENIPLVSFALLRGRCRACQAPIAWRYPLVEALAAVLGCLVVWRFGFSLAALGGLVFAWSLLALAFIDLDTQLLPDVITLPLLWGGLLINLSGTYVAVPVAVLGAVAGYLSLWSVYHVFRLVTGREGMGYGDFKLFGAIGAWLGWPVLPLVLVLAAVPGAAVGLLGVAFKRWHRGTALPFGPYLCIGGLAALLAGDAMMRAWLGH